MTQNFNLINFSTLRKKNVNNAGRKKMWSEEIMVSAMSTVEDATLFVVGRKKG